MVDDYIRSEDPEIEFGDFDERARDGLSIGRFVTAPGELSLRESCNKIVHATEARLGWSDDGVVESWNGLYRLFGEKLSKPWEVELYIADWSAAMIRLNKLVQTEFDWHHALKHDE
jgi:hypothetical protein